MNQATRKRLAHKLRIARLLLSPPPYEEDIEEADRHVREVLEAIEGDSGEIAVSSDGQGPGCSFRSMRVAVREGRPEVVITFDLEGSFRSVAVPVYSLAQLLI